MSAYRRRPSFAAWCGLKQEDAASFPPMIPSSRRAAAMGETPFRIVAERAPNLTDEEISRLLGQVYRAILAYRPESDAADRGEPDDLTRSAASDAVAVKSTTR
jgi:hypothetical protein